ncbi:AAA family ATPase [Aggregatilinea lenta]|uniref:AAA family ATPase n=1 Tax=Aggregatilinea lenta TaxID=913108 RepID=UPI000E5BC11B|nr:AAA family ATPase [Aggregatilinea lenta]
MKIERVSLLNFRQYYDEHRVIFAQHDQENVTVIHGVNGAGKTSFFLALNWCLYGEGIDNIGQITSKEAVSRAKVGDKVSTKVSITFIHEGERYMAARQLTGQKRNDGSLDEARNSNEFLLMRASTSGVATRIDNPIGVMNTILPSNVRTYFFFDGEKIDNFARPESAREVQEAIYRVLSLETLTRAKTHLSKAARDLRGQLKGIVSEELKDLISQDSDLRQQEEDLLERQVELRNNIATAQRHIEDVNQQLRDFEAVEALQGQYDLFTREIQERQQEFEELKTRIRDSASQGYIPLSRNAVQLALQMLDEKRERGEIPSNIRQQFIQDLLERHRCICGRPFADADEAHEHLVSLLSSSVPSSLEDNVLTTSGQLRALIDRGPQFESDLSTAIQDKVRLEQTIERLWAQRDDIQREMKGSEQIEVSQLARRRDQYQADKDEYNAELVRADITLEDIRIRIKELERQIQQARKTEIRQLHLSHKVELAQDAADILDKVYTTFAEHKRREVEQETQNIFHSLAWKGEHFQDVCLTENYQLEVIDRYGLPARPELSAGERQILSLSFITAMARAAQREAPLIMDTPFGRLSSAHREAITRNLPDLAPQLVLFVTDEELRDQALENLKPRIGAEYRLNFDPRTSCTTIEELNQ